MTRCVCALYEGSFTTSSKNNVYSSTGLGPSIVFGDGGMKRGDPIKIVIWNNSYGIPVVGKCDLKNSHGIVRKVEYFIDVPPFDYNFCGDIDDWEVSVEPSRYYRVAEIDFPKSIYNIIVGFDWGFGYDRGEIVKNMTKNFKRDWL